MKNNFYSMIRYLRLKEGIKLEYLATKLGISKSHMSLIERGKRTLSLSDFYNALNCLRCEIKILKNGNNELKIFDLAYELFDKKTIEEIKQTHLSIIGMD